MADKFLVVELKGGPPGDPAYVQPVRAARLLEEEEYLHVFEESGALSGLFLRSIVRNWREATEEETLMGSNQGSSQS